MNDNSASILGWIFRLCKGVIIGTGFIIPGVSGGVFAAIFGVYERMIRFFANLRQDFWANVRFFLPIGIGGLISMVVVSKVLGSFFARYEIPLVWFFVGCVAGTLPSLFAQAGKQGRSRRDVLIMAVSMIAMGALLLTIQGLLSGVSVPTDSTLTWLLAGALMGLGAIVPGLSPSNFLLYLGIYGVMMDRIGKADLGVLVPVVIGAGLCFILLSKVFDRLFERAYAGIYHAVLGVILASTIMILPLPGKLLESGQAASYSWQLALIALCACADGAALGYGMSILEKKYKGEV